MKKINGKKICYFLSVLFFIAFIIHTVVDYARYSTTLNSAPFYIWIIINIVYFIIPAVVFFIVGVIINKKGKKTNKIPVAHADDKYNQL